MNPVWLLPPILVFAIIGLWLAGKGDDSIQRWLNRLSRVLFGRFVSPHTGREYRIEAAYLGTTYRTYAAKTMLFVVLALVAGAIAGAYLIAGFLAILEPLVRTLAGLPRTITRPIGIHPGFEFEIATRTRWLVLIVGGLVAGVLAAGLSYVFRWKIPASTAEVRRRGIDEGLARTTAFMYALSRGGMEFPQIIRILTEHREVYGETANEMSVTAREMDLFGRDMITALRRMSRRTPSEQFKTFSENLTSILQSGSDLSSFLHDQYDRFREDAKERQNEVIELLATVAEAYVTVLVAGMLFLITILLVFGLTITETLWLLQLIVYLMIPLANAGFAVVLQQQLDMLGISQTGNSTLLDRMEASTPGLSMPVTRQDGSPTPDVHGTPDGGFLSRERENRRMLSVSDRVRRVKDALGNPLTLVLRRPTRLLWVTVPIAVFALLYRAPAAFQAEGINVRILDDFVVQSVLFVLATYAVVRYVHRNRIERIEAATPELLERLASLNEAGLSVVQGLDRVRQSDLGVLTPEVDRIWRDIEYGANVNDAFVRFGRRVRTRAVTRVVMLLTNAMRASGNMGPVLRIASEQARAEVKLRTQRRQTMLTYLVVIYVGFFVFLVIILAINEVLVPALPDTAPTPAGPDAQRIGTGPDSLARFGAVDQATYTLVFFHAAMIQAVCAGFIAGQLGEGSLRDGAKHAAIMLGIAYVTFILLSSPIASLGVDTQEIQTLDNEFIVYEVTSDGDTIHEIEEVTLSEGGFVAVYDHEDGVNGSLFGHSRYLEPGTHTDLSIPLDEEIRENRPVRLVVHQDTNDNQQFDFRQPFRPGESQLDRPYGSPTQGGQPGIEVRVYYRGGS